MDVWFCAPPGTPPRGTNVAVKTVALSIFALLLSASGGFWPLDKYLSWTSRKPHITQRGVDRSASFSLTPTGARIWNALRRTARARYAHFGLHAWSGIASTWWPFPTSRTRLPLPCVARTVDTRQLPAC